MNNEQNSSPSGLQRGLGPLMAIAITVGTVVGSGVFKKPQVVAENLPSFGWAAVVWVLGGVLAFFGALALAEVAVLFPRAGGNYVFLREGYGRLAGFLWGWVDFCIIRSASLAALATIFTESLHDVLKQARAEPTTNDVLGYWQQRFLTITVIMILALVNVRGVRWGGLLQFAITLVKVGSLVGIAVLPFVATASASPGAPADGPRPPTGMSMGGFGTAMLGVLWAYHGWMNLGPVAEEVKNPQRNLPLGLLGGVGIVIVLYLSANAAYCYVLPWDEIAAMTKSPVATGFAIRLLGSIGGLAISAAIMFSVFGALNGNLLVAPRQLYAMGQDGLAPKSLSEIHARYHTPALAIMVYAVWATLLVLGGAALTQVRLPVFNLGSFELDLNVPKDKSLFDILTDFAMFGAVIFETMAVTSIFIFRRRLPDAERPYRCWGYPFVPALYVILPAIILGNFFFNQQVEAAVGVGFIALGVAVYAVMFRKQGTR
jgi:amino acid transporter